MASSNGFLDSPLAGKSIVDKVIDRITSAIISGELKPGDRLPTETELADSLRVGRNSVREAVKVLASFGVVHIRRADGTFVCDSFSRRMLDPLLYALILENDSVESIIELRQIFDIGLLDLIIGKIDSESVGAMEKALGTLKATVSRRGVVPSEALEADRNFHAALTAAARNPLVASVADYIDRLTIPSRERTMRLILESGQTGSFIELHERIVAVIRHGSRDDAPATIKDHYTFWKQEEKDKHDI